MPPNSIAKIAIPAAIVLAGASGIGIYQWSTQMPAPGSNAYFSSTVPQTIATIPSDATATVPVLAQPIARVPLPETVRGFYWTAETARTKHAQELIAYAKKYGLNTVVIDLKMDNGQEILPSKELIEQLAAEHLYRIARIPVMRDSVYGRAHPDQTIKTSSGKSWVDKTGAIWLDPSKTEVADNAIRLARDAYALGFDEIQFDYVRFASDGVLSAIAKTAAEKTQTKEQIMKAFFNKVGGALKQENIPVSFDLFGVTFLSDNEVGIGQHMEDVYPNADFLSPMAYPSHYWPGYLGFQNPAIHPYEVVKDTLDKGAEMLQTDRFLSATTTRPHFRPWIQDFDIGATYTAAMIEAQIKAVHDAGASGWMLWNARNVYEPANYTKY